MSDNMKNLKFFFIIVVFSIMSYFIVSNFILKTYVVNGNSMNPTLSNSQIVFAKKFSHTYKQGDIVIIKDPEDSGLSIKRIIAIENQTVMLKNGDVYVNGVILNEPYLIVGTKTFSYKYMVETVTCGKNQYYVLGDNRHDSADSRIYGPVPSKNILAIVQQ